MRSVAILAMTMICMGHILLVAQTTGIARLVFPPECPQKWRDSIVEAHRQISSKLTEKLGFTPDKPVTIVVCRNHRELEQLVRQKLPEWVLGLAIPRQYTIGINGAKIDYFFNNIVPLLRHEMCHIYIGHWEIENSKRVPLWFNEGICEWFSGGLHVTYSEKIMESAAWDKLIPMQSLEYEFPSDPEKVNQAYCQSFSMIQYIALTYGEKAIRDILVEYRTAYTFSLAIQKCLGISIYALEDQWQKSVTPSTPWIWRILSIFSLFSFFSILALGVLLAYWLQKRRDRKILQKWQEEEEAHVEQTNVVSLEDFCRNRKKILHKWQEEETWPE